MQFKLIKLSKFVKLLVVAVSLSGTIIAYQNCSGSGMQSVTSAGSPLQAVSLSCSFNGHVIASGTTMSGYSAGSVAFGSSCSSVAEIVGCTNGVLSNAAAFASCSVAVGATCSFHGQTILSGSSAQGFTAASVPSGQSCSAVATNVTCANGSLSPAGAFGSCTVAAPSACAFNGSTIASGGTAAGFSSASVPAGSSCNSVAETLTCTNGVLSPANGFALCSVVRWPPRNNPDLMRGSGKKGAVYGAQEIQNGRDNSTS